MTQRTMVYKPASDDSDPARVVENDAGKWQWQIVELEAGAPAPDGWQSRPEGSQQPEPKRRAKLKLKFDEAAVIEPAAEPAIEDGDGHSHGN